MTDQEIASALEKMIREDGQRPPAEQVRDLLEAGVIDAQGRVLIGDGHQHQAAPRNGQPGDPGPAPASSEHSEGSTSP